MHYDEPEAGKRTTRSRKGKSGSTRKSAAKKELMPFVEEEADAQVEKEAEGPSPDEANNDAAEEEQADPNEEVEQPEEPVE